MSTKHVGLVGGGEIVGGSWRSPQEGGLARGLLGDDAVPLASLEMEAGVVEQDFGSVGEGELAVTDLRPPRGRFRRFQCARPRRPFRPS